MHTSKVSAALTRLREIDQKYKTRKFEEESSSESSYNFFEEKKPIRNKVDIKIPSFKALEPESRSKSESSRSKSSSSPKEVKSKVGSRKNEVLDSSSKIKSGKSSQKDRSRIEDKSEKSLQSSGEKFQTESSILSESKSEEEKEDSILEELEENLTSVAESVSEVIRSQVADYDETFESESSEFAARSEKNESSSKSGNGVEVESGEESGESQIGNSKVETEGRNATSEPEERKETRRESVKSKSNDSKSQTAVTSEPEERKATRRESVKSESNDSRSQTGVKSGTSGAGGVKGSTEDETWKSGESKFSTEKSGKTESEAVSSVCEKSEESSKSKSQSGEKEEEEGNLMKESEENEQKVELTKSSTSLGAALPSESKFADKVSAAQEKVAESATSGRRNECDWRLSDANDKSAAAGVNEASILFSRGDLDIDPGRDETRESGKSGTKVADKPELKRKMGSKKHLQRMTLIQEREELRTRAKCANKTRSKGIKPLEFPYISSFVLPGDTESAIWARQDSTGRCLLLQQKLLNARQWLKLQLQAYHRQCRVASEINATYIPTTLNETRKMIREIRRTVYATSR